MKRKNCSMTSKLCYQVQQISISQRATKDEKNGLKAETTAKMDGLKNRMEAKIDEKMENMKNDIKVSVEGSTKLIQEMFPNGEKILE